MRTPNRIGAVGHDEISGSPDALNTTDEYLGMYTSGMPIIHLNIYITPNTKNTHPVSDVQLNARLSSCHLGV